MDLTSIVYPIGTIQPVFLEIGDNMECEPSPSSGSARLELEALRTLFLEPLLAALMSCIISTISSGSSPMRLYMSFRLLRSSSFSICSFKSEAISFPTAAGFFAVSVLLSPISPMSSTACVCVQRIRIHTICSILPVILLQSFSISILWK